MRKPEVADRPLPLSWFERHPLEVAFDLIGCWLVVDREGGCVKARIVETEAYGGLEDAASHASIYRAGRTIMASPPGTLYMQFAYGMHTMTNIVCHRPGGLGAVLLRAAEDPVSGIDFAAARRGRTKDVLVGPGNLSQGAGTRLTDLGVPLDGSAGITILPGQPNGEVRASPRIGITKAADAEWRLFDAGSRSVSKHRRGRLVTRFDVPDLIRLLSPD